MTCPLGDKKGTSKAISEELKKILKFCQVPHSVTEIMAFLGRRSRDKFLNAVLKPAMAAGLPSITDPDKPSNKLQNIRSLFRYDVSYLMPRLLYEYSFLVVSFGPA